MYNFILILFGLAFACLILSPFLLFKWLNTKKQLLEKQEALESLNSKYSNLVEENKNLVEAVKAEKQEALELLNSKHSNLVEENKNLKEVAKEVFNLRKVLEKKNDLYNILEANNINSLTKIASLIADFKTLDYEISAKFLENKKHPAGEEAKRIRSLQKQTKDIIQANKLLQYKYEYLLQLFPELELYVDGTSLINEITEIKNLEQLSDSTDTVLNYLTKEEYRTLSENERNQLALDRYIHSQKTKWQIGRDYELFIGHEYEKDGWNVQYFGIEKQLEDMGRDLIAQKENLVHIIQCKYWSQQKKIHEKHIAQLYGTTIQYQLSNKVNNEARIIPVFITNIKLSETAKEFAKHLNVLTIENKDLKNFPRIKCNINKDEFGNTTKIYHLPIDQLYDRTKINKQGEFFAMTVNEAVSKGFRRAWKWHHEN